MRRLNRRGRYSNSISGESWGTEVKVFSSRRLLSDTASSTLADAHSQQQLSLQDRYWPDKFCYGCGPANKSGLHLKSFMTPEDTTGRRSDSQQQQHISEAVWLPQEHHLALLGVVNGGIVSTVLDCHSNILAAYGVMHARDPSCSALPKMTVTASLNVKFLKPTPMSPLRLVACTVPEKSEPEKRGKVWVEAFLLSAGSEEISDEIMTEMKKPEVDLNSSAPFRKFLIKDRSLLTELKKNATATSEGLFVALKDAKKV